ncbi:MAG: hypothetical protein JXA18_11700 [Chitinispirillaceae bacterium]|nr:hypothetical protein [Chitinispirillaceae bacterium]
MHPLLCSVQIDFATREFAVKVLGRPVGGKRKPPDGAPHDDADQSFLCSGGDGAGARPSIQAPPPQSADGTSTPVVTAGAVEKAVQSGSPEEQQRQWGQRPRSPLRRVKHKGESDGSVALQPEKKDNWFQRLRRNRYLFFVGNAAWRDKAVRWILRVTRTLFSVVRFDRCEASIRAGVEDPMVTGTIAGTSLAVVHGLTMRRPYMINFEPVFMTNHFECSAVLRIGTSLSRLLAPVAVAIVTFPAVHTLLLVWRLRRIEKRRNRTAAA